MPISVAAMDSRGSSTSKAIRQGHPADLENVFLSVLIGLVALLC